MSDETLAHGRTTMSDETLAALMAENAGLRASVNKYKRRAELANTRADAAEERARAAEAHADRVARKLIDLRYRLHSALSAAQPE